MTRLYRLAYLVSHPIQYQAPLLRYLAGKPDIHLTVFFLSDHSVWEHHDSGFGVEFQWDVPLLDGYKHVFLAAPGKKDQPSFWRPLVYGLGRHLRENHFDSLWIHGYAHQASLRVTTVAKRLGMKVLLRGESHLRIQHPSPVKAWFKERALPRLFSCIDGFLAIGSLNQEYYLHYGVPENKIFMMPYAVDNHFFQKSADRARPRRELLRAELGLNPGHPIILFASKLQRRKRPADLLEAYARLSPNGVQEPHPYLLFVGDGETRPELEARVRRFGWSSVRFLGFINQTELSRFYDLCDIFVLPSEDEPWGLVVNEVMNAGKPVIVSDQVGAGPDLVEEGKNGFIVPVGEVSALAERLRMLTTNPDRAQEMGQESLSLISRWDFEADYHGLMQAVKSLVVSRNCEDYAICN